MASSAEVSSTSLKETTGGGFIRKRNWGQRGMGAVRMSDNAGGEVADADFGWLVMIGDPEM